MQFKKFVRYCCAHVNAYCLRLFRTIEWPIRTQILFLIGWPIRKPYNPNLIQSSKFMFVTSFQINKNVLKCTSDCDYDVMMTSSQDRQNILNYIFSTSRSNFLAACLPVWLAHLKTHELHLRIKILSFLLIFFSNYKPFSSKVLPFHYILVEIVAIRW